MAGGRGQDAPAAAGPQPSDADQVGRAEIGGGSVAGVAGVGQPAVLHALLGLHAAEHRGLLAQRQRKRVQRPFTGGGFGLAAEFTDLRHDVGELGAQQHGGRVHRLVDAFARQDLQAQHALVVAHMAGVDLDDQHVEAADAVRDDVGHMEQGGQHPLGAHHRVDGEFGELADPPAFCAQLGHLGCKGSLGCYRKRTPITY